MSTVTILGAGVMGSSMSLPIHDRGHKVRLVGTHLDREIIDSVAGTGRHPKLNVKLPEGIHAFHHDQFAAALGPDTDLLVLGVSSAGIGWAIDRFCDALTQPVPVVMITKGMHPEAATLTALPDHVAREVKRRKGFDLTIAAIGGPCIAGELAVRRHTGTVITARDGGFARALCAMLETDYYHPVPRMTSSELKSARPSRISSRSRSAGPQAISNSFRRPRTGPSTTMPRPSSSTRPFAN